MLSDTKSLDIMLGGSHCDREGNEDSILARRSGRVNDDASDNNEENFHSIIRDSRSGNSADLGQNSTSRSSSAEFNKLSSELNSRISREMDEMMDSVSVQVQRAISDAINNQVLPQIQNALKAGSGHVTQMHGTFRLKDQNILPRITAMKKSNQRNNSRSESSRNCLQDENTDQAFDKVTGDNESPQFRFLSSSRDESNAIKNTFPSI